jgi:hypothetical protein
MILSYRDAGTVRFTRGERVKAFEQFRHRAETAFRRPQGAMECQD